MILLGVEDEKSLKQWIAKLEFERIPFSAFVEPDIGDQVTAIAINPSANASVFKELRLLS